MFRNSSAETVAVYRHIDKFPQVASFQPLTSEIGAELQAIPTKTDIGGLISAIVEPHSHSIPGERPHQHLVLSLHGEYPHRLCVWILIDGEPLTLNLSPLPVPSKTMLRFAPERVTVPSRCNLPSCKVPAKATDRPPRVVPVTDSPVCFSSRKLTPPLGTLNFQYPVRLVCARPRAVTNNKRVPRRLHKVMGEPLGELE